MSDRHAQPKPRRGFGGAVRGGPRSRRRHTTRGIFLTFILVALIVVIGIAYLLSSWSSNGPQSTGSTTGTKTGQIAPDFQTTLTNGSTVRLSNFRGHTVLLWFVTTWCSSCQLGAQQLASSYYSELNSKGIIVLTIELYNNLGQPGPSLDQFASRYGNGLNSNGWLYGTAAQGVTYTFDPSAYLDIYYLVGPSGAIQREGVGLPNDLGSIASNY